MIAVFRILENFITLLMLEHCLPNDDNKMFKESFFYSHTIRTEKGLRIKLNGEFNVSSVIHASVGLTKPENDHDWTSLISDFIKKEEPKGINPHFVNSKKRTMMIKKSRSGNKQRGRRKKVCSCRKSTFSSSEINLK